MSVSITGRLSDDARMFDAGDGKGFGIRLGEQYYDREAKDKKWTNYQCVIFAKNQAQIDFYQRSLVKGSVVSVTAAQQKVCSFDGQNGTTLYIEMQNAALSGVYSFDSGHQNQSQPSAPAVQPAPTPRDGFDDDIPF